MDSKSEVLSLIRDCCKEGVEQVLSTVVKYDAVQAEQWSSAVAKAVVEKISSKKKPSATTMRFCVNCAVTERDKGKFCAASACLWDERSDVCSVYRHEGVDFFVIVTVYALQTVLSS